MTQGRYRRRYVYDVRLGSREVKAVYVGRTKVWPTISDLAKRVTLGALEGEDAAYWHHAIGALRGDYALAGEKALISAHVCLAGKWFDLILKDDACPSYPLATFDGGTLELGDKGAPVAGVAVGDEALVQVRIPEHYTNSFVSPSENKGFTQRWHTRWLPGTRFQYDHYKGQKRVCPWANGSVAGERSGKTYFRAPQHNHAGHGRGNSTGVHWRNPEPGLVPDYDDDVFRVTMNVGGSSGITLCRMAFPAFSRSFRFKITDVVRHG